jgi:hypothetical protein
MKISAPNVTIGPIYLYARWIHIISRFYLTKKLKTMKHYHKSSLKLLFISILILIVIANSIILLSDPFNRTYTALWMMNISAAVASSMGIIALYRYGIRDLHGKSIMCLTIGLIFWFAADLSLLHSHYTHGKEELLVSSTDGLWFMGYIFLALHLSIILRSLRNERNTYDPSSRTQTKQFHCQNPLQIRKNR